MVTRRRSPCSAPLDASSLASNSCGMNVRSWTSDAVGAVIAGGAAAVGSPTCATAVPHRKQNAASGGNSVPQFPQACCRRLPQLMQNDAPCGASTPQSGQFTGSAPLALGEDTSQISVSIASARRPLGAARRRVLQYETVDIMPLGVAFEARSDGHVHGVLGLALSIRAVRSLVLPHRDQP